jgi:hypothetical protein
MYISFDGCLIALRCMCTVSIDYYLFFRISRLSRYVLLLGSDQRRHVVAPLAKNLMVSDS